MHRQTFVFLPRSYQSSRTASRRSRCRNRGPPLVLFLSVDRLIRYPHDHPIAQEFPQYRTQHNGNEDKSVERHDNQHEDVRHAQGNSVDDGAHELLETGRTERRIVGPELRRRTVAAVRGHGTVERSLLDAKVALELTEQIGVPFGA